MMKLMLPFGRLICVLACGLAGTVMAATPWPDVPFQYFAKQYPLPRVLQHFASAFGLKLSISPAVTGSLNGNYSAPNPTQFLNTVAASNGLSWYHYQGVLHVEKSSEAVRKTIKLSSSDVGRLHDVLQELGILDPRFGWGEFPDRGVVLVSGPRSYVDLIVQTVAELGASPRDGLEIRVFPLRHARVDDRVFSYRDQQVTTPGIASILRNLVATQTNENNRPGAATLSTKSLASLPAREGMGSEGSSSSATSSANAPSAETGGRPAARTSRPVIESDTQLNAVIVHDAPERMAAYEALIRQLDIPTPLVEIEAMIVDVNTDNADQLGLNWATRNGNFSFGMGDTSTALTSSTVTAAIGNSINRTAILSNTANYFLAQINALASKGNARVLARPSVLTSDNMAAVLDLSETFYIQSTGERVASVTPVSTGTMLKVIPRVIEQNGKRMVQLVVDIEDGKVQKTSTVSGLPTIQESTISTQAVVRENDSLLIGGYFLDSDSSAKDKVPGLGDVPILGWMFRNEQTSHQRRERIFMIRPHIVENPAATAGKEPPPAADISPSVAPVAAKDEAKP